MKQFIHLLCLLISSTLHAQRLPKNPSPNQVLGYQLNEQKKWTVRQLPRNFVLYKYHAATVAAEPYAFSFKKQNVQGFSLPAQNKAQVYAPQKIHLQSYLQQQRLRKHPGQKQHWWNYPFISPAAESFQELNKK